MWVLVPGNFFLFCVFISQIAIFCSSSFSPFFSATFDNCNNAMSSSSSSSSPEVDIVIVPNALCLSQIEGHPLLKLKLKDMENQAAAIARKIERKETRTFVVKNEIYQLLTFYVVFQGVVLTAVAQASMLKCRHWWAPFTLSLIASAMTFVGVYQKLETFRQVRDDFENERFNFSVNGLNFSLFCGLFDSLLYVSAMQET